MRLAHLYQVQALYACINVYVATLQMMLHWLHVQALAAHCSKITDSKLLQQSGQAILQTLRACHESASNLDDRSMAPKLYVAGFRALNSILAALRAQHGMSTTELVDLLRHFFTYGIVLDASGAQTELAATDMTAFGSRNVQDIGPASKWAYRPPHARRRSSSSTGKILLRTPCEFHLYMMISTQIRASCTQAIVQYCFFSVVYGQLQSSSHRATA